MASLLCASQARASDLEKNLRQQYRGKTFVLRGFYSGDHLRYDSSGNLIGSQVSGDWIGDGFVLITDLHVSNRQMIVEAKRLLVVDVDSKEFQIQADAGKFGSKLKIEADLQSESDADTAPAKIFLTSQDDLSGLVADYWKPCVREAAKGDPRGQRFSADILTIPGVAASASGEIVKDSPEEQTTFNCNENSIHKRGEGVPRVIHQENPEFSEAARSHQFQGTVTIKLVVDEKGTPQYIRVVRPIGQGLDERAVKAVKKWIFAPAERNGKAVPAEIAAQVDFHLY